MLAPLYSALGKTITELLFENNSQEDVGERNLQALAALRANGRDRRL